MFGFRQYVIGSDSKIIELYLSDPKIRIQEIAQQFHISLAEIYRILHANDISPNRLKANHQKVQHLAQLGWNVQAIAEFTGYTPRNVRYVLKRITENVTQ